MGWIWDLEICPRTRPPDGLVMLFILGLSLILGCPIHAASVPCPSGVNVSMHARPPYTMCLHNPPEFLSSFLLAVGYWAECEMYPFIIYDALKRSMADGIASGWSLVALQQRMARQPEHSQSMMRSALACIFIHLGV